MALAGDMDGDGFGELVIGSEADASVSGSDEGSRAWVVWGRNADEWSTWVDLEAEDGVMRLDSDEGGPWQVGSVSGIGGGTAGVLIGVPKFGGDHGVACFLPTRGG